MVYNPELMSESNWAYLASMEVAKDIQEDVNLFGAQIQAGVDNLYGALVDRKSAAPGKGGPRGQKEKGWNKEGENKDAIDRLQGIIEVEDPRFEKLKNESIGVW